MTPGLRAWASHRATGRPIVIDYPPGFVEADFFTIVLDYVSSGSYKSTDFEAYVASKS